MNYSTMNVMPEVTPNSTTKTLGPVEIVNVCVHSLSFLVGLPSHCYIILLIVTGAGCGVASEFFILNLSICEAGFSVDSLNFVLAEWFSFIVEFQMLLVGLVTTGRPLFQCLICVECYLAVVHPVTFLKYKPLRYRVICCAVAWILILGACLFCMYTIVQYNIVHIWFLSVQFILFFFIQLFCLVAVLRALKQSGPGKREKEHNHMKRRAFRVILITTVSMVITYAPYSIAAFLTIVMGKLIAAHWVPGLICYVLCGFIQPVLYLHRNGKLSRTCLL
ncbi:chemokine XC receptor 1-like [Danio aesculapii]|uniref:chemokine XC receptor 1-like n=1 Tax=Danio aesculapii TaxID=1142201 RepID=UPI0024C0078A|nr:chemokine XC receptor 1-like [Danio aesculapii]